MLYDINRRDGTLIGSFEAPTKELAVIEAITQGVDLRWARLNDLEFEGSAFRGVELSNADFSRTHFYNVTFIKCILERVQFEGAVFHQAELLNSYLMGASFKNARLNRCTIVAGEYYRSDWQGASINDSKICRVFMGEASLNNTTITATKFYQAILHGVTLFNAKVQAKFDHSELMRCDLQGASFNDCLFDCTALHRTGIEKASFHNCIAGRPPSPIDNPPAGLEVLNVAQERNMRKPGPN